MSRTPPDRIHIRDMSLRCIIGDCPDQRRDKQEVVVDLALHADLRKAGAGDRLEDTVDYAAVEAEVAEMVQASDFHLIEGLAERIAEICLARPGVEAVTVRVDKPGALRLAGSVGVEIFRERGRGG